MILKESYTYQNVLTGLIEEVCCYLSLNDNVTIKTQTHNKSKVCSSAEDETIIANEKKGDKAFDNNVVITLLNNLLLEKIALSEAIAKAKKSTDIDIDAAIESNKLRQKVARIYKKMSGLESNERDFEGIAYSWNNEQNQVTYRYPIKEVTTIDFDRNVVKSLSKQMVVEADKISAQLDRLNSIVEVDFEPAFDMHDSFREIYETFRDNQKK